MSSSPVFALTMHAHWACRHSGACCKAGWAIPVEPERQALLGGELLTPDAEGACRFYDRGAARCRVHRDHGEQWLPSSCFHFPRRALIDERGVRVTLSHFCPTAAELLVTTPEPLAIVDSPPAFAANRPYEGLDGRGAWPPLIKADLLFDLDGFSAWEAHVVDVLSRPASDGLRRLADDVEVVRDWSPDDGALAERIATLDVGDGSAWWRYRAFSDVSAWESAVRVVPAGLELPVLTADDAALWASTAGRFVSPEVRRRYAAAKAFGSWSAYEAFGLRTMLAEVVLADLVLRVESVRAATRASLPAAELMTAGLPLAATIAALRAADWLLVHLVDRPRLMDWLGQVETAVQPA